jgi:hypothetical protein
LVYSIISDRKLFLFAPTSSSLFIPPVEGKLIRGFEGLDVGDRVRVELIGTDAGRGFIDFAQAGKGQGELRLEHSDGELSPLTPNGSSEFEFI